MDKPGDRATEPLPDDLSFLKDQALDPEIKKVLLEKIFEQRSQERAMLAKSEEDNATRGLEQKKFWHNTPLVVALVGTITIGANGISSFFLADQNTAQQVRLSEIEATLAEGRAAAEADRETTKEERTFAFATIERELAKSTDMAARAEVLLFLVRAGILNSLNREELERMALADLERSGRATDAVGIPGTLGLSAPPEYDLAVPPPQPDQSSAAQTLLQLATAEINSDIEEEVSFSRVQEYWSALGVDPEGVNPDDPWSGAFISWLIAASGNPNQVKLSGSNVSIWRDAVGRQLTFLPGEQTPLGGDIMFIARSEGDVAALRSVDGRSAPALSGVVYSLEGETLSVIQANVGNAIRLREYDPSDPRIIGYIRFRDDAAPAPEGE